MNAPDIAEKYAMLRDATEQTAPPYDPIRMINHCGFEVREREMREHGLVSMTTREVFINARLRPEQRRFRLFHELTHILEHRNTGRSVFADDGHESMTLRRVADRGAEEGLMPTEVLSEWIATNGRDAKKAAAAFGTSATVAEIRLKRLDPVRQRAYSNEYTTAINSERWNALSDIKRRATGGKCQGQLSVCKGSGQQLHHLHYKSVGREMLEDVLWLCAPCHERFDSLRKAA